MIISQLSLISGWVLFLICGMQCSVLIILITSSPAPYITAMLGLVGEGLVYVALGEIKRMEKGI